NAHIVRTEVFLMDLERSAQQWLGFRRPVPDLQELRKMNEADGDIWMIGAEVLFVDIEGAPHQGLRLCELVCGCQDYGLSTKRRSEFRCILSKARLGARHIFLG